MKFSLFPLIAGSLALTLGLSTNTTSQIALAQRPYPYSTTFYPQDDRFQQGYICINAGEMNVGENFEIWWGSFRYTYTARKGYAKRGVPVRQFVTLRYDGGNQPLTISSPDAPSIRRNNDRCYRPNNGWSLSNIPNINIFD